MVDAATSTDEGVGLSIAFAVLAALGAILMLVGAPGIEAAWGFAGAMVFATLAIVWIHLRW